jgi:cell wall-associated NlpC family hydrolase
LALQGAPYRNGGSDPNGFDCSGFTQWVFAQHGIALPREVREQFELGKRVKSDKVLPGDLLFFHTVERGPSHVGIAIGPDAFVHAPSSRGVVRIERVSADYWSRRLIGIRRIDF